MIYKSNSYSKNKLIKNRLKERGNLPMKLLLSDGTAVAVRSYEKTSASVNGNTVDAVSIVVEKITLDKVKELFSDTDNLSVIHVYSDVNILTDTFKGYQVRVSIALGDTDNVYTVVLAKSSEVSQQISDLQDSVKSVTESLTTISGTLDSLTSAISSLNQSSDDTNKNISAITSQLNELTTTVNQITEKVNDNTNVTTNLDIAVTKVKKTVSDLSSTVDTINQQYTEASENLKTVSDSYKDTLDTVRNAYNDMTSHSSTISSLESQFTTLKELATNNDVKVLDYGKTSEVLTENVNTAKLAVEKFEESLSTTNKTVKDLTSTVSDATTAIESVTGEVSTISSNVSELTQKNEETSSAVEAVTTRVSALEPVTDYTTLSLEEAKKFRVTESKTVLATYLEEHPITSTCHGDTEGVYSITSEKQTFLQAMIVMATLAAQSGIEYQPSWNCVGEACTYDWTVDELKELAIEIEATVRPLVSHQQALEKEILAASNMAALQAVNISYENIKANTIVKNE